MPTPKPPSPIDLLMPKGQPIGATGSNPSIREVRGGQKEADDMFDDLSVGGTPVSVPGYPGKMVDLPGGGRIGLRPKSGSGEPTIDTNIPGIPIKKIKFV